MPFLGIHLTPRIKNSALIGPNAIPILNKDIQGYDFNDIKSIPSIIKNNIVLFTSNKNNYRKHAINEFSLNLQTKFYNNSKKYFSKKASKNFEIKLDKSTYGIRAQLFNNDTLSFENDFIYESINNNIHIVNAVSPAFTSSFSIAELILNNIEF